MAKVFCIESTFKHFLSKAFMKNILNGYTLSKIVGDNASYS